jgi:3-oxoacyl-[acyl-carrier protein] reductase
MELNGKNIIVTGGLKGLGKAIVKRLCNEMANVAVFDIDPEGVKKIEACFPGVSYYHCDVTNIKQVEQSVNTYFEKAGHIDILINNAGILHNEPLIKFASSGIEKHSIDAWHKVLETDLSSVFYMTANVVEKMIQKRTKGLIINISSVCAAGNAGQSAYSAAKAGVNALTATWAKELGVFGIRTAAVSPGFFDTESTHNVMNESILKEIVKEIPLRRLGKAEEVAEGIISVIKNDYYSGNVLEITGGLVI